MATKKHFFIFSTNQSLLFILGKNQILKEQFYFVKRFQIQFLFKSNYDIVPVRVHYLTNKAQSRTLRLRKSITETSGLNISSVFCGAIRRWNSTPLSHPRSPRSKTIWASRKILRSKNEIWNREEESFTILKVHYSEELYIFLLQLQSLKNKNKWKYFNSN